MTIKIIPNITNNIKYLIDWLLYFSILSISGLPKYERLFRNKMHWICRSPVLYHFIWYNYKSHQCSIKNIFTFLSGPMPSESGHLFYPLTYNDDKKGQTILANSDIKESTVLFRAACPVRRKTCLLKGFTTKIPGQKNTFSHFFVYLCLEFC